ncbi:hypothetical protein [Streptomyces clavuligerus]|nr:hypothetical protein [Streptomyces clavuligerus]WDN56869.1 hypothetical protein LL058_34255 [Streptomyces clavuligerus]
MRSRRTLATTAAAVACAAAALGTGTATAATTSAATAPGGPVPSCVSVVVQSPGPVTRVQFTNNCQTAVQVGVATSTDPASFCVRLEPGNRYLLATQGNFVRAYSC